MKLLQETPSERSLSLQTTARDGSLISRMSGEDALMTASAIRARCGEAGGAIMLAPESSLPVSNATRVLAKALESVSDGPVAVVQVTWGLSDAASASSRVTVRDGELVAESALDAGEAGQPSTARLDASRAEVLALAGSGAFARFIARLKSRYRFVLIEGRSLRESAETVALAQSCDGVILLIERGRATSRAVLSAQRSARASNLNIIGFVLEGGGRRGRNDG